MQLLVLLTAVAKHLPPHLHEDLWSAGDWSNCEKLHRLNLLIIGLEA
jgi:hypothetical protein